MLMPKYDSEFKNINPPKHIIPLVSYLNYLIMPTMSGLPMSTNLSFHYALTTASILISSHNDHTFFLISVTLSLQILSLRTSTIKIIKANSQFGRFLRF